MTPGIHLTLVLCEKFQMYTSSPLENVRSLVDLSKYPFCLSCFLTTFCYTLGCNKSNLVLNCRPNISSAGDRPVVLCGVIQ